MVPWENQKPKLVFSNNHMKNDERVAMLSSAFWIINSLLRKKPFQRMYKSISGTVEQKL